MTVALNQQQLSTARRLMRVNASGYDGTGSILRHYDLKSRNAKHNLNYDFGYPETNELTFQFFYQMYKRNGLASALVEKTVKKCWQEMPKLIEEGGSVDNETTEESTVRQHLNAIRFWQKLATADRRSMVGKYGAVIFQLNDGKPYHEPVEGGLSSIEDLISVIPAWEGQLEPAQWDTAVDSPTYGQPLMYRFNESSVDPDERNSKLRSFTVHPSRCYIWSADGTLHADNKLEAPYNALLDSAKIRGAGGEGFWKNAKSQPILTADPEVDFNGLAAMLGVELDELPDALDEVVTQWTKGFDESLMLQGMKADTLNVDLPIPEHFWQICVSEIAAAWPMPQKILTGSQTGERASTEDSKEWSQTCSSRRSNELVPNIMDIVRRFIEFGIMPDIDWEVYWADLTAPTLEQKLEIADKMGSVNQRMFATGEVVFTEEEIREAVGYEPLTSDDDLSEPTELDEDEDG